MSLTIPTQTLPISPLLDSAPQVAFFWDPETLPSDSVNDATQVICNHFLKCSKVFCISSMRDGLRLNSVAYITPPRINASQHEKLSYYSEMQQLLNYDKPCVIVVDTNILNFYFSDADLAGNQCSRGVPYTYQAIQYLLHHLSDNQKFYMGVPYEQFDFFMRYPTDELPLV